MPDTAMRELDFNTASLAQIVDGFLGSGCVLLRQFVKPEPLNRLIEQTWAIYEDFRAAGEHPPHIELHHLRDRGLPPFHDGLFEDSHYRLLEEVFGGRPYRPSEVTATRRIDGSRERSEWQAPLGPHLDSFFHEPPFTVNFWVPFCDCGIDAPSLAVVHTDFSEVLEYSGFDRCDAELVGPVVEGQPDWNFARFHKQMYALAYGEADAVAAFHRRFASRAWTPSYIWPCDNGVELDASLHARFAQHGAAARQYRTALRVRPRTGRSAAVTW